MAYVRASQGEDAYYLAPRLREADKNEIAAASGLDPLAALLVGLITSQPCRTICAADSEPIGIFGVVPDKEDKNVGSVWMMATDRIEEPRNATPFLRQCRDWVEVMNGMYPTLWNAVDARNELHLKWLKWCGFEFTQEVYLDPENINKFILFERTRPCANRLH